MGLCRSQSMNCSVPEIRFVGVFVGAPAAVCAPTATSQRARLDRDVAGLRLCAAPFPSSSAVATNGRRNSLLPAIQSIWCDVRCDQPDALMTNKLAGAYFDVRNLSKHFTTGEGCSNRTVRPSATPTTFPSGSKGGSFGLVGESGCGKSTVAHGPAACRTR